MIPPTPPRDAGPPPPASATDAGRPTEDSGHPDGAASGGASSSRSGHSARQSRWAGADELPPDDPARQQFQSLMQGLPVSAGLTTGAPGPSGERAPPGPADHLLPHPGAAGARQQPPMPRLPLPEGAALPGDAAALGLAPAPPGPAGAAPKRPQTAEELTSKQRALELDPSNLRLRWPTDEAAAAPTELADRGATEPAAAQSSDAPQGPSPDHDPAAKDDEPLPSPMALFSPRAAEPQTAAPARPDAPTLPQAQDVATQLALHIERLAVSHSHDGQRRVRLAVAGDALPDTDIEIGEVGGEMQVMFFCRSADARRLLEPQAHTMAGWLAERLQRPVWLSVGGQQRDEPGRTQVHAQPGASTTGGTA